MDHPSSSPRPSWQLRVLNGPLRGTVHLLGERFGIGRAGASDLQLTHEAVSRQHAHIATDDEGQPVLVDMVSSNGSFVDGRRVQRQLLRPHAIVRIADTELVFEPATEPVPTQHMLSGDSRVPVALVGSDGIEHGGRLLDEIIEYRMLRARSRRDRLADPEMRARFDTLADQLRQPSDAESEPERRGFWRFACALPATLRMASGEEQACRILDLAVDGARLHAPEHGLEFDEIVWLSLLLEAEGQVQEQVLAARVAWVSDTEVGMAFAGAPRVQERARAGVRPEGFDEGAPTVRLEISPGETQNLGLVIGSSRSRARHWS